MRGNSKSKIINTHIMKWVSPWTAIVTLILILTIRVADPKFVESVRLRYFDTLITGKIATQNSIYTVNIDEKSLEQYGQWPFPRDVYAGIIKDLYERKAGLVVFNVLMPETDRSGKDLILAETMKNYPVVLSNVPAQQTKNEPKVPGSAVLGPEHLNTIVRYPGMIANIPLLENSAVGVGTTNTLPEIDGVNRRLPLIVTVDGKLYPNLAVETLRVATNNSTFQVKLNANGVEKMRLPGDIGIIDTDSLGRVWIDWSQKNQSVSLSNLPQDFKGAIVIVGTSAAGIGNPVATAIGPVWPQDLQAAVIGTMINRVNIKRPDWAEGAEVLSLIVLSLGLLFLSRWVYVGMAAGAVAIVAVVPISNYFYTQHLWLLDGTLLVAGLILVMLHAYGIKFVSEYLQKQRIKKQFGGYASPMVVEMLQKNPDIIKQGIKKEVSICFSDLRGFTPLGESFGNDVKGLTEVMNGYMDAITQPVLEANGMIIKYIGDASMHIHNAPIDDPEHPKTAVRTALNMLKAVEQFNKELTAKGRPAVGMGAGINTGLGYIGEMGSTQRHSYDVLGDAVSTTARIESKCKEYGCLLLVGENTVKLCGDDFFFLKIDDLAVKGKSVGIGIYTVLDNVTEDYAKAKEKHNKMHELYRSQKFSDAIELCEELKSEFDGKMTLYYNMWIERCEFQATQTLPKDWDGIFHASTK
jgi:adenylate cyclase